MFLIYARVFICSSLFASKILQDRKKASYPMNVYTADRGPSYANVADNYFGGARSYKDRAGQECSKVATSGHPNVPKLLRH